jgi:hypothetical protein
MIRSLSRIKKTAEIFTPHNLVNEILDSIPDHVDSNKTILDPSCGNGQFLINVAINRKCLTNIFGIDLMVDNVCDTIARLYFFNKGFSDPFTHTGHLSTLTIDIGHDQNIHPDYYWLINNTDFIRKYFYNDECITIEFAQSIPDGVIFKCNGELYPTIVCADSLKFLNGIGYDYIQNEITNFNKIIKPTEVTKTMTQNTPQNTPQTKPSAKELFSSLLDEIDALELKNTELTKELKAVTKLLDDAELRLEKVREILK